MHVLNVSLKHVIGGTPQVCLDYTNALASQGAQVTTLVRKEDPFISMHEKSGAQVEYAKLSGKFGSYDPFAILYFISLLNKIRPDVIIAHDGRAVSLCRFGALGKIPVVDVNHGRGVRHSSKTSGTIVINPQQLERTLAGIANKKNVTYIPNMVDINDITANVEMKPWCNPPVIGALGRLVHEKAYDVLIDALAILKSQNVKFRAIIGGDGILRNEIEAQIARHNLQGEVELCGWINNPDEFYKKMDVFCLSSRSEACPKVLLEAMKFSLPVVVTDAEGPRDIIKDGHDGIMVEKNNPAKLADGLKRMLENRAEAERMANNAYQTIGSNYSIPVVGRSLYKMLEQVQKGSL